MAASTAASKAWMVCLGRYQAAADRRDDGSATQGADQVTYERH